MEKDVNAFCHELADYINRYIAGKENTHIKKCEIPGNIRNRGHVISMVLDIPKDLEGQNLEKTGSAFYAEEILEEFPNNTTAHIGEILNVRVNEHYEGLITMLRLQIDGEEKTIDDYGPEEIILTAMPTSQCDNMETDMFISKTEPLLGLTVVIKGQIGDAGERGQCYFAPVKKADGHGPTDDHWETARQNSLNAAKIHVQMMPAISTSGNPNIPAFGIIQDTCSFYDFFYLLSLKDIWKGMKEHFSADRVYIIPNGAYQAFFVMDTPDIRKDAAASGMAANILKTYKNELNAKQAPLPVFVLDCNTFKVDRYEEG